VCPAENTSVDYVGGNLDNSAIGELDAHLDSCPSCRFLFAGLVRRDDARSESLAASRRWSSGSVWA
jgi:hypothetical protein